MKSRKGALMSTHTPGPWTYDEQLADSGNKETEMVGESEHLYEPVCVIPHDDITEEGEREIQANARLIAAAPDLLEALRGVLDIGKRDLTNPKYDGFFESARRAVQKATGAR